MVVLGAVTMLPDATSMSPHDLTSPSYPVNRLRVVRRSSAIFAQISLLYAISLLHFSSYCMHLFETFEGSISSKMSFSLLWLLNYPILPFSRTGNLGYLTIISPT